MPIPNIQALEHELKTIVNDYYDSEHCPRQAAMYPHEAGRQRGMADVAELLLTKYFDYNQLTNTSV